MTATCWRMTGWCIALRAGVNGSAVRPWQRHQRLCLCLGPASRGPGRTLSRRMLPGQTVLRSPRDRWRRNSASNEAAPVHDAGRLGAGRLHAGRMIVAPVALVRPLRMERCRGEFAGKWWRPIRVAVARHRCNILSRTTEGGDVIAAALQMSGGKPAGVQETAAEFRHRAAHVRWLLSELSDPKAQHSLEELAEELEARAAELEPD